MSFEQYATTTHYNIIEINYFGTVALCIASGSASVKARAALTSQNVNHLQTHIKSQILNSHSKIVGEFSTTHHHLKGQLR